MSNPFYAVACSLLLTTNTYFAHQPSTEWTWHKTSDGLHPDGEEQTQIWLMNRARQDPTAEGHWLAEENDRHVASDRWVFGVDTDLLKAEFANFAVKPPAAFDVRLYRAAAEHNQHMITVDRQTHEGQVDRTNSQGLVCKAYHGNVFSHSKSALHAHTGYNIDWGDGPGGMQKGRLHRLGIMSLDGIFSNVGTASIRETDSNTRVGPWVTTSNFCNVDGSRADHHNRFIVGTVWEDKNNNARYDPDEGKAGVAVTPDKGDYFAVTSAGGGYAIPITAAGSYRVSFTGSTINGWQTTVSITEESTLLDYLISENKIAASTLAIHSGEATVDHNGISIALNDNYTHPLAFLGPPTRNGRQPALASLDFKPDKTLDFRVREWNYLDQFHQTEAIPYLVINAGSQFLVDGSIWEANSFPIEGTNHWQPIRFQTQGQQKPYLFLSLQSHNGGQLTTIRVKDFTPQGFQAALFEQESFMDGHKAEIAAYLAIFPSNNNTPIALNNEQTLTYSLNRVIVYDQSADQLPGGFMLQEETSLDAETNHIPETVDILEIGNSSFAQITSMNGSNTVSLRKKP